MPMRVPAAQASRSMLSCVSITPFGYAVVPEVNWMRRVSVGETSRVSPIDHSGSALLISKARAKPVSFTMAAKSMLRKRGT
jgi:predicted anti-sigma-YlaC factor YlaD